MSLFVSLSVFVCLCVSLCPCLGCLSLSVSFCISAFVPLSVPLCLPVQLFVQIEYWKRSTLSVAQTLLIQFNQQTDIDECKENTDNCSTNAQCHNTPGSFNCTCNSGFKGDGINCSGNDGADQCSALSIKWKNWVLQTHGVDLAKWWHLRWIPVHQASIDWYCYGKAIFKMSNLRFRPLPANRRPGCE